MSRPIQTGRNWRCELERRELYRQSLVFFAKLARSSRKKFREAVEYYLYRDLVIFNDTNVGSLALALQRHGGHVRTLVYDAVNPGPLLQDRMPSLSRSGYLALDRCFASMTDVHALGVYGSHSLFLPRQSCPSWKAVDPGLPEFAIPRRPLPALRKLTWIGAPKAQRYDQQILHALSMHSLLLEDLIVHTWNTTPFLISSVPMPLPRLVNLQIFGGLMPVEALSHLLNQTITTNGDGGRTSSLRMLVLWLSKGDEDVQSTCEKRKDDIRAMISNHPSSVSLALSYGACRSGMVVCVRRLFLGQQVSWRIRH